MTEIIKDSYEKFAVLSILAFSILYRILLLQVDAYPPGPDIGLHESIINSMILKNGNFTWNYYHMGGGVSLTHPGFHIFTSFIILITGMPDYIAQSFVVVMFSSLIVLCVFLVAKAAWSLPLASLIAAFMAAISRYDLEMLLWGGYPNVVTLMIMPLIFYILLRKDTSPSAFIVVSSLLIGTLVLTHSLTTLVFLCIAISFIFSELVISRKSHKNIGQIYFFASSILFGFIIMLPFLVEVFPVYLENVSRGMFIGGVDENRLATILTRSVPLYLVLASLIPAVSLFLFSKKYKGEFFSESSVLLSLWMVVPAFSTQSFVIGLYTDYYRLLHFLILPLIIFLALLAYHGVNFIANFLERIIQTRRIRISSQKILCISSTAILMLTFSGLIPFFTSPSQGFFIANYYDVVSPPEFESIKWILQNTPANSVFVSEHGYGWWVSGFGQRVTLSATDPQFLMIPHEFEAAYTARTLLDTDFILNNGLIQIRDDGGYIGRHNPLLSVKSEESFDPYPILYFNESETTIFYSDGVKNCIMGAAAVPVKDVKVDLRPESVCILIIRGNENLVLERKIEVFKGVKFAVFSVTVESLEDEVSLRHVRLILHARGKILQRGQSVGVLNEAAKICGQVIFKEGLPLTKLFTSENPTCLEMFYNSEDTQKIGIQMMLGGFEVEKVNWEYVQGLLANTTGLWCKKEEAADTEIKVFDYREVISRKEILFVAFKRKDFPVDKFQNDPLFNLVFINENIVIFKVKDNLRK